MTMPAGLRQSLVSGAADGEGGAFHAEDFDESAFREWVEAFGDGAPFFSADADSSGSSRGDGVDDGAGGAEEGVGENGSVVTGAVEAAGEGPDEGEAEHGSDGEHTQLSGGGQSELSGGEGGEEGGGAEAGGKEREAQHFHDVEGDAENGPEVPGLHGEELDGLESV